MEKCQRKQDTYRSRSWCRKFNILWCWCNKIKLFLFFLWAAYIHTVKRRNSNQMVSHSQMFGFRTFGLVRTTILFWFWTKRSRLAKMSEIQLFEVAYVWEQLCPKPNEIDRISALYWFERKLLLNQRRLSIIRTSSDFGASLYFGARWKPNFFLFGFWTLFSVRNPNFFVPILDVALS